MGFIFNPFIGEFQFVGSTSGGPATNATKLVVTKTANEDIVAGELVRSISSTHVQLATADNLKADAMVLGIAETSALASETVDIILNGISTDAAFGIFTVGDPLFLDIDGGITNTKRVSGYHLQVGKSLGGNDILFELGTVTKIA